jgi:hypothetical protein
MKDLYARLDLRPSADEEELAASLRNKPGMESAAAILLDRGKRARYDRAHATLKTIGALRQRLKLDTGDSWFLQNCPDFAPGFKSAAAPAKPEARATARPAQGKHSETAPQKPVQPRPAPRSARSFPTAGLVGAAILLALAALYFLVLK